MPPPASIQYATFHATFYATVSKRTLTATTGEKDSNSSRAIGTMGRLSVKVVPGSSRNQIVGWLGDALKIKVTASPEKGRANEAVVDLLAETLGINADHIQVENGHSSPSKVIAIIGMDDEAIRKLLPDR